MNDTREIKLDSQISYSRRKRDGRDNDSSVIQENTQQLRGLEQVDDERPRRFRLGALHHFYILVLSLSLTATTVVLPYMAALATDYQQFNLYTGLMMVKNQLPYTDVFATGGFLFYALIGISQVLGSQLYLLVVQFIALYVSGIYLYKILLFYTENTGSSMVGSFAFYLTNVSLGFGGLYPMQWAMPFVLMGTWFLVRYFAGLTKDEGFIGLGLSGAMSLILEPRTLIFWGLAVVFVLGYNLSQKHFARGIYQFLATILGLILVLYTVGYFVFNLELTIPYLTQALTYNVTHLAWGSASLWQTALMQAAVAFFSGLLLGGLSIFEHLKQTVDRSLALILILLNLIAYVLLALLSQSWAFYQLLPVLPYGLILTMVTLDASVKKRKRHSHRRQGEEPGLWGAFIYHHLFGPLVLVLLAVALPFYQNIKEAEVDENRQVLVDYLTNEAAGVSSLVIIDNQADIYLKSERRTATHYPVASLYQASQDRVKDFEDDFLSSQSELVVVNHSVKVSKTISSYLSKNYLDITPDGVKNFSLYQIK